jgi:exosome complex component RRP40
LQGRASGFGRLEGGLPFVTTNSYARNLLRPRPPHPILQELAKTMAYEVVVGINGRIWVNAGDMRSIIKIRNVLIKGEFVDELSAEQYVKEELQKLEAGMAPPR